MSMAYESTGRHAPVLRDWDTSTEAMAIPGPNPLPPRVQEERAG